MMQRWVVHGAERFTMPNAQKGNEHLEGRMMFDAPLKAWLSEFLDLVFLKKEAGIASSLLYGASMPATEMAQS